MSTTAKWLTSLGMSEYAQRFAENKIDVSVLRHLTDQDLKDIGVPLGHRRKMLAAIAELGGAVPASPHPTFTEPKTQDTAERRQVTVMFSDLVGSTALSARTSGLAPISDMWLRGSAMPRGLTWMARPAQQLEQLGEGCPPSAVRAQTGGAGRHNAARAKSAFL